APVAARAVRRGRHAAGDARTRGRPVRRLGGPGLRGVHGQARDEGDAGRGRHPGRRAHRRPAPGLGTAPRRRARGRRGAGLAGVREARPEDLDAAIELARRHDPKVVVETAVAGREIECAVLESLDGGPPATSLPGEIEVISGHEFYDFEAKYLDPAAVRLTCPADLPDRLTRRV